MMHRLTISAMGLLLAAGTVHASQWREHAKKAADRGLRFLAARQQADGGWKLQGDVDPAVTALVVKCFAQHPEYGPERALVRRGVAFLLQHQQPDGGIYLPERGMRNYYTSVAVMALSAVDTPEAHAAVRDAQAFLKKGQWDEGEGYDEEHVWYGGAGYGKHKRPDLSNTQMMLEALHQSGLPKDDPTYRKAIAFISRCQMSSESNDQPFARGVSDGGFIYSPANGGESKAGVHGLQGTGQSHGRTVLRSYGSMTYAGFKSMLYAGLKRDDPRVKAGYEWIRKHYTLDENPNMPGMQRKEGLYYYYHTFARALDAWFSDGPGGDRLVDADGVSHDWRRELCEKLVAEQRDDGSWINTADRWYEGDPVLVTAYAILAMQTAAR